MSLSGAMDAGGVDPSVYSLDLFVFSMYPLAQGERRLTICFPVPLEGTEMVTAMLKDSYCKVTSGIARCCP